ncbi:MAG TPA: aminotransferase class I/II-fold pyridoxal phosphate-dependent enzyme, partial [Candidatus Nanoarchaeia archaeon]|nr:aminotransferase class I/II-fold pyridoxal phosphate-dependent enzyme [Candidatus Nanoarchaeia archaeon]
VAYAEVTKVFDCIKPQGAFFLFPDVSKVLGKRTAEEFSMFLLKEANVAVVPGDAFGAPKNIRISYTRPIDEIREGFERIGKALKKWK